MRRSWDLHNSWIFASSRFSLLFFCLFLVVGGMCREFFVFVSFTIWLGTFFGVGVEIGEFLATPKKCVRQQSDLPDRRKDLWHRPAKRISANLHSWIAGGTRFRFCLSYFLLISISQFFLATCGISKKKQSDKRRVFSLYQWNSKSPLSARVCRLLIRVFVSRCWYWIRRSATDCELATLGEDKLIERTG